MYFIGNKKILLLFPSQTDKEKDIDEIGTINDKGIFIPEYLLKSKEKSSLISLDNLDTFFNKDFSNFVLGSNKDCFEIRNQTQEIIGNCIKLDNNQEVNKEDPKTNKIGINPYIELMINIYLFEKDLKYKVSRSIINTNKEFYYITSPKWMEKLKVCLDYDKFLKVLISGNIEDIINKTNPQNNYNEFLSEVMKLITNVYINEIDYKIKKEESVKYLNNSEY